MANEKCTKCGTEMVWKFEGIMPDGRRCESRACPLDPKDCHIAQLERELEEAKSPCHRSHPHEDDPECPFNSEVHVSVLRSNAALRSDRTAALAEVEKLKRELEEARFDFLREQGRAEDNAGTIINLEGLLRAREVDVLALREALEQAPAHGYNCEGSEDDETCGYCYWHGRRKAALSTTSATAQEIVARIEREAVEKAWARLLEAVEHTRIAAGRWEPGIVSKEVWVDGGEPMISARESRFRAAILGEKPK